MYFNNQKYYSTAGIKYKQKPAKLSKVQELQIMGLPQGEINKLALLDK